MYILNVMYMQMYILNKRQKSREIIWISFFGCSFLRHVLHVFGFEKEPFVAFKIRFLHLTMQRPAMKLNPTPLIRPAR